MSLAALGGLPPPKPLSSLLLTLARLHAPQGNVRYFARPLGGKGTVIVKGKHVGMLLTGLVALVLVTVAVVAKLTDWKLPKCNCKVSTLLSPQEHTRHPQHIPVTGKR